MRKLFLAAIVTVVASAVVAEAGTAAKRPAKGAAKAVKVSTRKVPKLGTVLVNDKGLTLYMFVPDKRERVTCTGGCAAVWPPLMLPKGARPTAAGAASARLLGSDPDPSGGRVVTYNRWPLYTYVGDSKPGQTTGQALNLNGGLWYAVAPSGAVVRAKAAAKAGKSRPGY